MKTAGEQDMAGRLFTRSKKNPSRLVRLKKVALHGPPKRIAAREPFDVEQGWMPMEPREWRTPDRVLRAAILERAVLDAQWDDQDARKHTDVADALLRRDEAIRWIHGLTSSPPTFRCVDICDVLGIPVEKLRALIPGPRPWVEEDAGEAVRWSVACGPDRD